MSFSYLQGKSWAETTRDERFFCSHLMHLAQRKGLKDFVTFLDAGLDPNAHWELGFEVCFYRDLWHARGKQSDLYSPKRTFDLCLFSEDTIVIIEAKAQQGFDDVQLASFTRDKEQVRAETGVANVLVVGLASSKCPITDTGRACFSNGHLTWGSLAAHYDNDSLLLRADDIYEVPVMDYGRNNLGGHVSGAELMQAFGKGEDFFVGRFGGLNGAKLGGDIESGHWQVQLYETNRSATVAPNDNWFRLGAFVGKLKAAEVP